MVECHKHGKCVERILYSLSADIDFKKVNWCAYVIWALKRCKNKWKGSNQNSLLTGPLGIFTMLYADCVECKGTEVDREVPAIGFWPKDRLTEREVWELENGGFGTGRIIGLLGQRSSIKPAIENNKLLEEPKKQGCGRTCYMWNTKKGSEKGKVLDPKQILGEPSRMGIEVDDA